MTLKNQFVLTDSSNFKIQEVFGMSDQILMLDGTISAMKALLNNLEDREQVQDKFQTCKNAREETENASTAIS